MSTAANYGFYIHIPFCPHICPYCDFIKTSRFKKKDVNLYFQLLMKQLDFFIPLLTDGEKVSVYFGGGTPGLFPASYYIPFLEKLNHHFHVVETTLETNPFTNSQSSLRAYARAGFNRLTLGAQSLCPDTLNTLGRRHVPADVLNNIRWAKEAGFENIQVDLIYGLKPKRSVSVRDEVLQFVQAGASGVSAYALTLEHRTLLAHSGLACDEVAAQEYLELLQVCSEVGFFQMETSNFSRNQAHHNQIYWEGKPYFGLGTGAHGLLPPTLEHPYGRRYRVGDVPKERQPGDDLLLFSEDTSLFELHFEEPRLLDDYLKETLFTLLRTQKGVSKKWLINTIGYSNVIKQIKSFPRIERAIKEGLILEDNEYFWVSPKEKIRGDVWALDFIISMGL